MEIKFCKKCSTEKPLNEFGKKLDKQAAWCKECTRAWDRKWYSENRESVRVRQNKFYQENSVQIMDQMKQALKDNPERGLLRLARQRCKKSGVPCTITEKDIFIPEFCPIFGVKLEFGNMSSRDNSPSLDRVIPELGYVPGNVQVMSFRANRIKNHGSAEEHRRIAEWMESQLTAGVTA